MKKQFIVLLVVILLGLTEQSVANTQYDVGKNIYYRAFGRGCNTCHDIPLNPQLRTLIGKGKLSRTKFEVVIRNGRGAMPKSMNEIMGMKSVITAGYNEKQALDAIYNYLKSATSPKPAGIWDIKGYDNAKNDWIATLVLKQDKNKAISGYADWIGSNGSSGREYLIGTYTEEKRLLVMHVTKLKYSDHITRGSYIINLSSDGKRLVKGKWSEFDPKISGSWSATRISP